MIRLLGLLVIGFVAVNADAAPGTAKKRPPPAASIEEQPSETAVTMSLVVGVLLRERQLDHILDYCQDRVAYERGGQPPSGPGKDGKLDHKQLAALMVTMAEVPDLLVLAEGQSSDAARWHPRLYVGTVPTEFSPIARMRFEPAVGTRPKGLKPKRANER
jgi:hypothetical protein